MLLYFLLALIIAILWQIHADIHRANKHLLDRDPGIGFFKPGRSRVPSAVAWGSRGIVAAVIIALAACAIYINR